MGKYIMPIAAVLILALSLAGNSVADEFGSGANSFDIDFVTIGDPGNPDDTTGSPNPAGSVDYSFRMGKFEISRDMVTKANNIGNLGITLLDLTGGNGPNRPARMSWNNAARFVNWLNTSTGHAAAYKFNKQPGDAGYSPDHTILLWAPGDAGYDSNNRFRNRQAKYVLSSYDEWYKAAYYDPTSGTYFDYPTGSNTGPIPVTSGTAAGTAVYDNYTGPADITQAGGLSPYGTMGQGGNMSEWEESEFDLVNDSSFAERAFRGGLWFTHGPDTTDNLRSSRRSSSSPIHYLGNGIRVASSLLLGDANGDGDLNNLDITAFGLALIDPVTYAALYPDVDPDVVLDMNADGSFNNLDITGFGSAIGF